MRLRLAAAALALPLLAACAPELDSTIYVRDIDEALSTGKPVSIPATLKVPQTGTDSCTTSLPDLVANLGKLTPIKGAGKCTEGGGDAFAEIETTITIEPGKTDAAESPLFAIRVEDRDDGGHDLVFVMSKSLSDLVATVAPDEPNTDFDPPKFALTISNDGSDPVAVTPGEVYLDGSPAMPADGPTTLERRHDAEVVLSNVASEYVALGKAYRFASVGSQ